MPLIVLLAILASHKHTADRANDVARQEYALHLAEFNLAHGTSLKSTKKNIVVYDPQTGTVDNQNVNDVYHQAGHKSVTQYHSSQPAAPSKVRR